MDKQTKRFVKKGVSAVLLLAIAFYFAPWLAAFFFLCGLIDSLRNTPKTYDLFERYFLGNGILTWVLSPVNLLVDLISYRNPGVWKMDDLPEAYRAEVQGVLDTFVANKDEIIAQVDRTFENGRRGMYVWKWYGKQYNTDVEDFTKEFKYVQTIAISVFSGTESTKFHFGPLRMSLRVLLNLTPVETDKIFIECQGKKYYWHENPLFIFDDTLLHRSVNELDARRYCVFMDVARPTPFPGVMATLLSVVSVATQRIKGMFYKNWKMLSGAKKPTTETAT